MSPSMLARVDDIRFQNGYASARNYEVLPNGSLVRRPGLRHVRRCKFNDKRCRLIPFEFSVDQTMQIEFGEKYFRFHQFGGTLLYATPKVIASVSAANDTITFTARHNLASNTAVRFTASAGGTIPGGLVEGTTYYVLLGGNSDAKTIQVSATAGPGAALNIDGTVGVGTSRMFLESEMPRIYFNSRGFAPADVNTGTEVIDLGASGAHGFVVGDPIRFNNTGGGLPVAAGGGLTAGVTYFVIVNSATTIRVARTLADALAGVGVDFTGAGTGTHEIHRLYVQGDLVHYIQAGHGVFVVHSPEIASGIAPSADPANWHLQPEDGVYEVPHPYIESKLAEVTYDQSNDIISLTHRDEVGTTFTTTGDTDVNPATNAFTELAHSLRIGDRLTVTTSGAFPAATPALAAGTNYFVVEATASTFKIGLTPGGAVIDITADAAPGTILTWTQYIGEFAELRRLDALRWIYVPVSLAPQLAPPVISSITRTFGAYQEFTSNGATPTLFTTINSTGHGLAVGDSVWLESQAGGIGGAGSATGFTAGYHEVAHIGAPSPGVAPIDLRLKTVAGGAAINGVSANVFMRFASLLTDTEQRYKVTAVTEAGLESAASADVATNNNLSTPGSSNLVAWSAVTGASRYRIYRLEGNSYSFLGQSETLNFKDDGDIIPDKSKTIPIFDNSLGNRVNSPSVVTHFEQRRFAGGTFNIPNGMWATRSGTESDLTFHIPVQDDDRLKFQIASAKAVSIRHLVPMRHLLALTNSTEFRIVPVDSDVLTPDSIDSKAHSYRGCSIVRPTISSDNLVFCAARGGHVFEMGYGPQGALSKPGDLCLRSSHLFDGKRIEDQSQSEAPHPIVWFPSSSGLLLGLTYVPEEQIGAWHAHDTAASGAFESVSVTEEGDEDARYFIVRRTINAQTVRSVEMMSTELFPDLARAYFVDAGGSFDGTNTTGVTMTVSGGTTWNPTDTVTITSSNIQFTLGQDDVGDRLVLTSAGTTCRIRITAVLTNATATGVLLDTLPVVLRNFATTAWAFARDTISGLDHLEGQTVQVFGDGLVQATRVVVGGSISPATPAVRGCAGLGMPSPVRLLPIGMQTVEAWGQGRTKNVNQAALRVVESGPFLIGPNATSLVPANVEAVPGSLVTDEARVTLEPEWTAGGQITIQINDPLPLTLLGIVMEVSLGD